MTIDEARKYFGSHTKIAKALRISLGCVSNWQRRGYIPGIAQLKLQKLSNGKLKADLDYIFNKEQKND